MILKVLCSTALVFLLAPAFFVDGCNSCLACPQDSSQSPKNAAQKDIKIEGAAEFKQLDDGGFGATIDLGKLPVGRQVVIELTLHNPFDREIHFSGTSKKCSCSQFKAGKKVIPKLDEWNCRLAIKTPSTQKSLSVSTPVILVQDGTPVVRMELNYQLEGLLAFGELLSVVKFEDGEKNKLLDIPILTSPPVDVRKVRVDTSENLGDLKFEIVPGENGGSLRGTVTDAVLKNGQVRGELTVVYPETGQDDRYYLIIKDARSNEISPQIIHFRRQGAGLAAKALIRIRGEQQLEKLDGSSIQSDPISCWHQGNRVALKIDKLSSDIYRVEILVDEQSAAALQDSNSDSAVLTWKIDNGKSRNELTTPYIVDEADVAPIKQ